MNILDGAKINAYKDKKMEEQVYVMKNCVNINRWFYNTPYMEPDKNGEIILIFQYSMGPAEWWKWSIDAQGKFWMEYRWCEDDFYEDDSFKEEITKEEMIKKMQYMQRFFDEHGVQEYVEEYRRAEEFCNTR